MRGRWGNDALAPKAMPPLDAATVASLRKMKNSGQVYSYRKRLKTTAKF